MKGERDDMADKKTAVTVTLPAPHKAKIKCPICKGNKCVVCKMTGNLEIGVAPKIPIQRAHIIKYVEITKTYGLVPDINTIEVLEVNEGQYEIVQVSSLGGACWVVSRLDEVDAPKYFTSRKDLEKFKQGWMN